MESDIYNYNGIKLESVSEYKEGSCRQCYFDADRLTPCPKELQYVCSKGRIFDVIFGTVEMNEKEKINYERI